MSERVKKIMRKVLLAGPAILLASLIICHAVNATKPTPAEGDALMALIRVVNHTTVPYKATVLQQMLAEANYSAGRLHLPVSLPIEKNDLDDVFIPFPWFNVVKESNAPYFPATIYGRDIANTNIPFELRLRALKFAIGGRIQTTNFEFGFTDGKLTHVMRLSDRTTEYLANDLGKLVGQHSLIDTNGAYQLATQWLSAVSVDISALEKQFGHSLNQLAYTPRGASNFVLLPLFYVGFGTNNSPKWKPASYDPAVEVEILGTTKELQDLSVHDPSYCRRQAINITNALDLVRTQNLPMQSSNSASSVGAGR